MSEEQRLRNLGIDPDLRSKDPAAYRKLLHQKGLEAETEIERQKMIDKADAERKEGQRYR
jgi:hypothetical protein